MNNINIQLDNEMHLYVNENIGRVGFCSTASEFIRDLIYKDMCEKKVMDKVMRGLDDMNNGRFSSRSILDIVSEELK